MKTFKQFLTELTATTKDGHQITTYFETEQGSKYILSDKNESKRIKSVHANTGGADAGLKTWKSHCLFVPHEDEVMANAPQFMIHRFKHHAPHFEGNQMGFFVLDNGKWRVANKSDAYPKSFAPGSNTDGPILFRISKTPTVGFNVVEYDLANKMLAGYHLGSPVSKIKKISELTQDEVTAFADQK